MDGKTPEEIKDLLWNKALYQNDWNFWQAIDNINASIVTAYIRGRQALARSPESSSPLATELAYFNEMRLQWVKVHEGEYAVVQDRCVMGFYNDYEIALRVGLRAFGTARLFLIKQVFKTDRAVFIGGACAERL